jgi:lipopolysaccharide/colanic/teichoic acid biosynthesis glycosyltransferase
MALLRNATDDYLTPLPLGAGSSTDPALLISLGDRIQAHRYARAKRVLDLTLACILIAVLLPAMLVVALAIAVDSRGPILFRQTRIGKNARPFDMYKFRTMRAERRLRNDGPPHGTPDRRRRHKSFGDPRVTRVGKFLRRTCMDELPQLFNVVRGDMSLVGPRPELPSIVATYEPWQHTRHLVPPGITGWWQVNRMGDRLMHESTELDIYYVHHCSLLLDLMILARTLGAVMDGTGAY